MPIQYHLSVFQSVSYHIILVIVQWLLMEFVRRTFVSVAESFHWFLHLATLPLTVAMVTLSARFDYSRHRVFQVHGIVVSRFWVFDLVEFYSVSVSCPSGLCFLWLPFRRLPVRLARVRRPWTPTWCNCRLSPYVPVSGWSGQVSCGPLCPPSVG